MPDIKWNLKVNDESRTGFQSYLQNLRTARKEEVASGEANFERAIKSGPEGLLKLAGVGLGAAIIQAVVGQLKAASDQIREGVTGLRAGKQTLGGSFEGAAGKLPFGIGEGWQLGRNIRELITGEDAQQEYSETKDDLKSHTQAARLQMFRTISNDRKAMIEAVYQTNDLAGSGVKSQAARLQALRFAAKQDVLIYRGKLDAASDVAIQSAAERRDAAKKVLNSSFNYIQALSPFPALRKSATEMLSSAARDYSSATGDISNINREKYEAERHMEGQRRLREKADEINLQNEDRGAALGSMAGLGGRLGSMSSTADGRALAYKIQTSQFLNSTATQLSALGWQGHDALQALKDYGNIALDPLQVAKASGQAFGPLQFAGSELHGTGFQGLAANAAASWQQTSNKVMGQDDNQITTLLQKIYDALTYDTSRQWNNQGDN